MQETTSEHPQVARLPDEIAEHAETAAEFLRAMGHRQRLMIICHLVEGERSVGQLETLLDLPQASVSQHLARLRRDKLVVCRRDGKSMHYALADDRPKPFLAAVRSIFCQNH